MSSYPVRVKSDSVNGGTYDYRKKAAALWRDSLEQGAPLNGNNGSGEFIDFTGISAVATAGAVTSDWLITAQGAPSTANTATMRPAKHGVYRLGTAATGAVAVGGQICRNGTAGPIVIESSGRVLFETSLDNLLAATGVCAPNFFTGLYAQAANSDKIIAATAVLNTTRGYIGFARLGSAAGTLGALTFVGCKDAAGSQATVTVLTAAQVATLVAANTKINLGFSVNAGQQVEIFVNGEYQKTASDAFNLIQSVTATICIPLSTIGLTPAFAWLDFITSGSIGTVSMDADWVSWAVAG